MTTTPLARRFALAAAAFLLLPLVFATAMRAQQDAEATPEATETPGGNVERIDGTVQFLSAFRHRFEAEADEAITLIARDPAGTLDPVLRLLDERGDVLAENDNHETGLSSLDERDAVIERFIVPETAEYTVEVTSGFQSEGPFELLILRGAEAALESAAAAVDTVATPAATPGFRIYGPCTVTADFISARMREAPTVNSRQVGSVRQGDIYSVVGRVRGADGLTWYRLSNYYWVRSDAVIAEGACRLVPSY